MGLLQKTSKVQAADAPTPIPLSDLEEYPIPSYQFSIQIDNKIVALFQTIEGMAINREVEPLKVGGENFFGREFPGHISYGHITFGVGLSSSDFFHRWMTVGEFDGYAISKNFTLMQRRPNPEGDDPIFSVVKRWNFINAFPVSWKLSDLSMEDSHKIVIESLELSFDYFTLGA